MSEASAVYIYLIIGGCIVILGYIILPSLRGSVRVSNRTWKMHTNTCVGVFLQVNRHFPMKYVPCS